MPFGLIPWGTGSWGLAAQPPNLVPPPESNINVIDVIPSPGSFNISRVQTFTFTIKSKSPNGGPGNALNLNSIYVFLDGQTAIQGNVINPNFSVIVTTNIDGVSLDYQITPNYSFKDSAVFTLQVYATDIYGNPSYPFWAGYVVENTRPKLITPIYPLDGYVDVPLDLSLHFLVNQLAAPSAGLDPTTLNIYVNDNPAVVDGQIQSAFNDIYSTINLPISGDITTPFEVVLDSTGNYAPDEIVTVKTSIKSIIIPVEDGYATFLNSLGLTARDAYGSPLPEFSVTTINKLSNSISQVTLDFGSEPSLIADGYIGDGYQLKNSNGNVFRILDVIDDTTINIETLPKTLRGSFTFVTAKYAIMPSTPVFAGYFQGVYLVDNLGDGYHVNVTWHPARTTRANNDLAYLIYYSTVRSDVFYEGPKLITQGRRLPAPETINGADAQLYGYFAQIPVQVGVTYYFGVRATEFPHTTLPAIPEDGYGVLADGLVVVDGYSFEIPTQQVLMEVVSGSGSVVIPVTTTAGYASAGGYITVGAEIMRYTSLTDTEFVVSSTGRGLFGTEIQPTHNIGEYVRMYYGNYDDNTVIAKGLVSWETPHDSGRTRPDLVTTDFTLEDGYHTGFEYFDYCGYHRYRPDELFNDQQCNTYVGGEYNGHRGLNLYDRMLANEEQLLEVTGEPSILLRRIWSGGVCICRTSRKDSAAVRSCALCFGTGFKGGYVQYFNPRRADNRIMVHFAPSDEEIAMKAQAGWDQTFTPGTWTLAVPSVKDRDVIVRFDEYGQMDWIYVVDSVSRGKLMFGRSARQKLKLSRLDKTNVLYQFKIVK